MKKDSEIIEELYNILNELDARESSGNCISDLSKFSWVELCDMGEKLFSQLKR